MKVVRRILLGIIILLAGCMNSSSDFSDEEFKYQFNNSILTIFLYQKNVNISSSEVAKSHDFLEKVTNLRSSSSRESPFFYKNDTVLVEDVKQWINWYKSTSKSSRLKLYKELIIEQKELPNSLLE